MSASHALTLPLTHKSALSAIKPGDAVYLSGIIVTARDMAHHFFTHYLHTSHPVMEQLKPYLERGGIYHCGPVIDLETLRVISAGPTTSIREEPYQAGVVEFFNLAAVIGKGGMGEKTRQALKAQNCLYLNAVGGAGSYYAGRLKVKEVLMLKEFGMPEALWVLEVRDFFTLATMTPSGESLHETLEQKSRAKLNEFLG